MSWHFWNDRVVLCRQFRTITAGLFSSHSHSDHCYLWSLIDWNGAWGMLGYGKAEEHFTHHLLSLAPLNADAQVCSFSGGVRLSGWAGAEQKRAGFDHRLHHEEKRLPLLQRHVSGGETDFRLSLMSFQTRRIDFFSRAQKSRCFAECSCCSFPYSQIRLWPGAVKLQ